MRLKELNALLLTVIRDFALQNGVASTCSTFSCSAAVAESIRGMTESRIHQLAAESNTLFFTPKFPKGMAFWEHATEESPEVDWAYVASVHALLWNTPPASAQ